MTADDIVLLKQRLWNGEGFNALADEFGLKPYTVQAIIYGHRHAMVPWPDGMTGPMDPRRRAEIRAIRRQAMKEVQGEISERTQVLLNKKARQRKSK